jgi:AcrR family transcriptional regulator
MDMTDKLTAIAEELFEKNGFSATGMDRLTEAAGMSSRTLYKRAGSKAKLMGRVLAERDRRFMKKIEVQSVDMLFAAIEDWLRTEGARGCFFLRAFAETGGKTPEIAGAFVEHKAAFQERIAEIVASDLGHNDPALVDQVLVLLEGATHAAVYRGYDAVSAARGAAAVLTAIART